MAIQVLIADDHHIFRQGLVALMKNHPSYRVIAETGDGKQALDKIKKLKPDIAILDISMPKLSGLEIAKKIKTMKSNVQLIILTMYTEEEFFREAIDCGVKGYVLKDNSQEDLITALESVSNGKLYVSPLLFSHMIKLDRKRKSLIKKKLAINNLTSTEREILKHIAENKTSKQIASDQFVSFRTIQNHRTNICRKLDLQGTNALLEFAIENKSSL